MSDKIIKKGNQEAYELLSEMIKNNVQEDLREVYNYWDYLDFTDEVFGYMKKNKANNEGPYDILEPVIQAITEKINESLKTLEKEFKVG